MSTVIDRGTLAATTRRGELPPDENPRTRRYGINPAVPVLLVHPRNSGRQEENIPFGYPLRIETVNDMMVRNWSVDKDDKSPPVVKGDLTALDAVNNIKAMAWQSSRDMGFRELSALTGLADKDADRLLESILPQLDAALCRYGQENTRDVKVDRITQTDDGALAVSQTFEVFSCLTCTMGWLESAECEALSEQSLAAAGLRRQLLEAYRTNRAFFRASWAGWMAEMQKREKGENGLAVLGDDHLHVMYQLHETSPTEKATELLSQQNEAQGRALERGFERVADRLAERLQPQPTISLADIKQGLLADPEFRRELAAEAKAMEEQEKKTRK